MRINQRNIYNFNVLCDIMSMLFETQNVKT